MPQEIDKVRESLAYLMDLDRNASIGDGSYMDDEESWLDAWIVIDWAYEEIARRDKEEADEKLPVDKDWLVSIGGKEIEGFDVVMFYDVDRKGLDSLLYETAIVKCGKNWKYGSLVLSDRRMATDLLRIIGHKIPGEQQ